MFALIIILIELSASQQHLKSVRVLGSSIVKHAFCEARRTYDGCNLGLKRNNFRVLWQGKSGMKWGEIIPRISLLLQFEEPPEILVIHCGGNNIGQVQLHQLRLDIKASLFKIKTMLPNTKLIWSQILPRFKWRYSKDSKAMNIAAERINNFAAWLIINMGAAI